MKAQLTPGSLEMAILLFKIFLRTLAIYHFDQVGGKNPTSIHLDHSCL